MPLIVVVSVLLAIACSSPQPGAPAVTSATAAQDAPALTLITNVNVWDGKADSLRADVDVLIENNLIMVTGGDMFGPASTGVQADNITALVNLMEWSPVVALRTATSSAGEVLAWSGEMNPYKEGKIGMVGSGYYADVIIVDGNPLEDVHMIDREHVRFVMKDGKTYKNSL